MKLRRLIDSEIRRLELSITIIENRMRDYLNTYKGKRINVSEMQVMLSEYGDNAYTLDTLTRIAMESEE